MGKAIAFLVALIAGVVVVGWVVSSLIGPALFYLIVGALAIAGGYYAYTKVKKGIAPAPARSGGSRRRRRRTGCGTGKAPAGRLGLRASPLILTTGKSRCV